MMLKISLFILFYFLSRMTFAAADCTAYSSYDKSMKVCWDSKITAYISSSCFDKKKKCDALSFLKKQPRLIEVYPTGTPNLNSIACQRFGYEDVVLSDSLGNQESFCLFKDGSLLEAGVVAGKIP